MKRGYTLVEMLLVLTLVGAGVSLLAGPVRRLSDDVTARMLCEEVVTLVNATRLLGRNHGGARLTLHQDGQYAITAGGSPVRSGTLGLPPRASLRLSRGRDSTLVSFDRLGLGRMASTTIAVRIGDADRAVVLSSYGRLRRR
jgi:prepilin-type N-terminal cleavage/methylation domain-containing protein